MAVSDNLDTFSYLGFRLYLEGEAWQSTETTNRNTLNFPGKLSWDQSESELLNSKGYKRNKNAAKGSDARPERLGLTLHTEHLSSPFKVMNQH